MNTTTVSKRENPLHSLLFNIVIPVMILKNGTKWLNKFFGDYESANSSLGFLDYSSIGFGCALIFPIIYFSTLVFFFRKMLKFLLLHHVTSYSKSSFY